jgi:7,8-dihydroneopterin aldolase/epimerase/oxygenase
VADRITLTGLAVDGFHGVFEHEKRDGQRFVVDVVLWLDLTEAARTDDLTRTVHYGEVAEEVVAVVRGEPVDLIETLAQRIADACLARPAVQEVEVTVHKPQAPITVPFDDVAITITRRRP